jgi:hypothetical protein
VTEQVLIIDFERAQVVVERNQGLDSTRRRTVLGDLSNLIRIENGNGNGSGKGKRKWKEEEEDIDDGHEGPMECEFKDEDAMKMKKEEQAEKEKEEEEESDRLFKQELRRAMYEVGTIRDQPVV